MAKIYLLLIYLLYMKTENVSCAIPSYLMECYNNSAIPGISLAMNRPPATLNVLVDLIRKIENEHPTLNARELSVMILQRFRHDGIVFTNVQSDYGLPVNDLGRERKNGHIQLKLLTPSNNQLFNNDSLSPYQRCSLHYMISSTIDSSVRTGEVTQCVKSARYSVHRYVRDTELDEKNVELYNTGSEKSECPIEYGIVDTEYGVVKASELLAGIAAGFERMQVTGRDDDKTTFDNLYASTISGQMAEVGVYQASTNTFELGAKGGWNSTIEPKYYFLERSNNLEFTDAEIRGALDGFYLGKNISDYKNFFSDIKLSEIIDLYYSPRGLFNNSMRACNRKFLLTDLTTTENLLSEVTKYLPTYAKVSDSSITFNTESYKNIAEKTVDKLNSYVASISDKECGIEDELEQFVERSALDLIIFVDKKVNYNTVKLTLSQLLQNLDINKQETKYAMYNGSDGSIIINRTSSLTDFYEFYNLTVHEQVSGGFDYNKVFQTIENIATSKLNNKTYAGGDANVILIIPNSVPNESQKSTISSRSIPDMKIVVAGPGSSGDYTGIVSSSSDFFPLTSTNENELMTVANNILNNIKEVSRAVINPNCEATFIDQQSSFNLEGYVEPNGINYYRIAPNYFAIGEENRNLKVKGEGYGVIHVCYSRSERRPNAQNSGCKVLYSNSTEYDLSADCDGVTSCSPIYLSVQGNSTNIKCSDRNVCRFKESIKYTISLQNVGCASSTMRILGNIFIISVLFMMLKF